MFPKEWIDETEETIKKHIKMQYSDPERLLLLPYAQIMETALEIQGSGTCTHRKQSHVK